MKGLFIAALLGLCALAPAHADTIAPVHYSSIVDMSTGMAHFAVQFDRLPDLLTVDAFGRQADSFQFWTDTVSPNPIQSTFEGIADAGPLGTQSVLTAVDIPTTGKMTWIWPQDASYTGPRDSGGWGIVVGQGGYTLASDGTVSFDVPLSVLHSADGNFYYGFETYRYGAWGGTDYFGEAGQDYWVSCVPEPSQAGLLAGGLLTLAVLARRRRQR
jgi:hypothetical protein